MGKCDSHSGLINRQSSLLLEFPRNKENLPFEGGISINFILFIKSLKSVILLRDPELLPLSSRLVTSLKSPMIRHGTFIRDQNSYISRVVNVD